MRRLFIHWRSWLAIGALVVNAHPGRAQTWVQWNSGQGGNNHYYAVTPTATNWDAAQKLAISWGGTLATITSSNEQNFINTTFLIGKFEHLPLWIGLLKPGSKRPFSGKLGGIHVQIGLEPKADFRWVTDEALSYINWKSGEPSDSPPGEDYVAINWAYSDVPPRGVKGDWNDTPLNGTTGYRGNTDGPYFGLVERESDPNGPVKAALAKAGFMWYARRIALMIALAVLLIYCFARFKKYERSRA
jgi:hypothetical protein